MIDLIFKGKTTHKTKQTVCFVQEKGEENKRNDVFFYEGRKKEGRKVPPPPSFLFIVKKQREKAVVGDVVVIIDSPLKRKTQTDRQTKNNVDPEKNL